MKKLGVLTVSILIIVMIAIGSIAYAFYSSAKADFTLIIHSAEGAAIGLDLTTSSTTLSPANTTVGVNDYSIVEGAAGQQYAAYTIGYEATSAVDVKLYISDVVYTYTDETEQNHDTLHAQRDDYLDSIIGFCISLTALTYDWSKTYFEEDTLAIQSIAVGSGSFYCYVRFNVSQELVPPVYHGTKISFRVNSEVQED